MSEFQVNSKVIRAVCRSCGGQGGMARIPFAGKPRRLVAIHPEWCTCKKEGGPYEAPRGYIAKFTFESREKP